MKPNCIILLLLLILTFGSAFSQTSNDLHPQLYDKIWNKVHNVMAPEYGAVGDSITNDSVAFWKAINAMESGDVLYVPPGKYFVGDTLYLPKNCLWYGVYGVSQIYMRDTIIASGGGVDTLSGNWIHIDSSGQVHDLYFSSSDTTNIDADSTYLGAYLRFENGTSQAQQDHVHVSGISGIAIIDIRNADDASVTGCYLRGSGYYRGNACVFFGDVDGGLIANNYFYRAGRNEIFIHGGNKNVTVRNNTCEGNIPFGGHPGHSGILVSSANPDPPVGGYNIILEHNRIFGHEVHNGIDINPNSFNDSLGIIMRFNNIYGNEGAAINVIGGGVSIYNNWIHNNANQGIRIAAATTSDTAMTSEFNYIYDNEIDNNDTNTASSGQAIYLDQVANSEVVGNKFKITAPYATSPEKSIFIRDSYGLTVARNGFYRDSVTGGVANSTDEIDYTYRDTVLSASDSIKIFDNVSRYFRDDNLYSNVHKSFTAGVTIGDWQAPIGAGTNTWFLQTNGVDEATWAAAPGASGGEANTMSKVGTGHKLFLPKSSFDFPMRSLVAGTGITMDSTLNEITINSTSGGGGAFVATDSGAYLFKSDTILRHEADDDTTRTSLGDNAVWQIMAEMNLATFDMKNINEVHADTIRANGNDALYIKTPGRIFITSPTADQINITADATNADVNISAGPGTGSVDIEDFEFTPGIMAGVAGTEVIVNIDSCDADKHQDGSVDGADLVSTLKDSITTAHTHVTSDGSDHSFIDQDVTIGSSPTLDATNMTGILTGTVEQVHIDCRSASGTIPKGNAVHIDSWSPSGYALVIIADASDTSKMPAIAVAESAITTSSTVTAVKIGSATSQNTDTITGAVDQSPLYVAPGGGLTVTKPTNGHKIQKIGIIARKHASQGVIEVVGAGRENDLPNGGGIGEIFIADTDSSMKSRAVSGDGTLGPTGILDITFADSAGSSADEKVQDKAGAMTTGNTETGISVDYQDGDGTIDYVVSNLDSNFFADNTISLDDVNWPYEYISLDVVHGDLPDDSTEVSLSIFETYTPILFRDSTWNPSAKDTVFVTGVIPYDCSVDSLIFIYKVTGTSVLIDQLILRGPDHTTYTGLPDSTYYTSGTNYTSTSIARVVIDLTDRNATGGDIFGLQFANDLSADDGTVKVYTVQLAVKR